MLNDLQPDLRELINLVHAVEKYDTTMAIAEHAGKPIAAGTVAVAEHQRKSQRIAQLREKWNI